MVELGFMLESLVYIVTTKWLFISLSIMFIWALEVYRGGLAHCMTKDCGGQDYSCLIQVW